MAVSDLARLKAAALAGGYVERDPDLPPTGPVGDDRDGAFFWMGADPCWLPVYEGQAPAVIPAPRKNSFHDHATCIKCGGTNLPDGRQTCAGCMVAGDDAEHRIIRDLNRDEARKKAKAEREAAEKGPTDYAARKYRKAAREARKAKA
jgi:hypothetical protein